MGASEKNPQEAAIHIHIQEGRKLDREIPGELDGVKVWVSRTDPFVAK